MLAINKKAKFNYFLEETLEVGLVLQGWEVKSILAKKINIEQAHVVIKDGEAYLFNANIIPAKETSTHIVADPTRNRKLLLHKKELNRLVGKIAEKGYTLVPTKIYFNRKIKLEIALAKGKKLHDKRDTEKERDWNREKSSLLKQNSKKNF
jgi:SsrA-binding protein